MQRDDDKNPVADDFLPDQHKDLPDHPLLAEIKVCLNQATEAAIQTLHEALAEGAAPVSEEVRSAHTSTLNLMNDVFYEHVTSMLHGAMQVGQAMSQLNPRMAEEIVERALFALRTTTAFYAEIAAQVHCFANVGRPILVDQTVLPAGAELLKSIAVKVTPESAADAPPVRPN